MLLSIRENSSSGPKPFDSTTAVRSSLPKVAALSCLEASQSRFSRRAFQADAQKGSWLSSKRSKSAPLATHWKGLPSTSDFRGEGMAPYRTALHHCRWEHDQCEHKRCLSRRVLLNGRNRICRSNFIATWKCLDPSSCVSWKTTSLSTTQPSPPRGRPVLTIGLFTASRIIDARSLRVTSERFRKLFKVAAAGRIREKVIKYTCSKAPASSPPSCVSQFTGSAAAPAPAATKASAPRPAAIEGCKTIRSRL
jgi:hypothetical protein